MENQQLNLFTPIIDVTEKEHIEFRYEITSYGADYPVDSLVSRIKSASIFVPPFQRQYIWDIVEASRFIESLILGLPVPGIFLSKENGSNRLLVVDGQQRLLSLSFFYEKLFKGKEFALVGVQDDLEGKTYDSLKSSDKLRLDDSIIHATVFKQDEPDDDNSSIYQIFERINSEGRALSPQEIRACIYYGKYNEFLKQLTQNDNWRFIIGGEHNDRLKEEELILRFFSLLYDLDEYKKPMKDFLNKRMAANRNFEVHPENKLRSIFELTLECVASALSDKAFRLQRGLHTAIFDSAMVGIAKSLLEGKTCDSSLKGKYELLLQNPKYLAEIASSTSDENTVLKRVKLATETFNS